MLAAIVATTMLATMVIPSRPQAQQSCDPPCERDTRQGCFASDSTDIIFMVDRSGSIAERGQTYNLELEGIIRALRDTTVIPRDGSVAVGVLTFNRAAQINVPLTVINSASDAAAVIAALQALKCATPGSAAPPCPVDDTDYNAAIMAADIHFRQSRSIEGPRYLARRIMLMSSDGAPNIADFGARESTLARNAAARDGLRLELDAFLVGLESSSPQFETNRANLERIAFRVPASAGQPIVQAISGGDCNRAGASLASADCNRQADEFATRTRSLLRSDIKATSLVVNTDADTDPNATVTGGTLSLRQAIERANCNGGNATITFAESVRGKTIRPLMPLPAITQPEITIDGCDGANCNPSVTIDGSLTDTSQGEHHCDGILIRSSRDTVRGLRIINFKRAGVAITPCSIDSFGMNRVELNRLENNTAAGVLVCDPPAIDDKAAAAGVKIHSEGNTISRNAISGSATLIDLGCTESTAGPTANDAGDEDAGPNTLLNFPGSMAVATDGSNVKITGQANGPTVAGATIEIFGVTQFHVANGRVIVDGVSFLASTTADTTGAFMAAGVAPSATGIYTATVTDVAGNTSELLFDGDPTNPNDPKLPKPQISVNINVTTPISFGNVDVNGPPQTKTIEITNTGNAPLTVNCRALVASCTAGVPGAPDPRFTVTGCPTAPLNSTTGPNDQMNKVIITITFRPNPQGFTGNVCGPTEVCLTLDANDPLKPVIASRVTATVVGVTQPVVSATQLVFKRVAARAVPRTRKIASQSFTVENSGCENLVITFGSILRTGNDVSNNRRDDTKFFTVMVSNPGGPDTVFGPTSQVSIARGTANRRTFTVLFNPVIPSVSNCKSQGPLSAEDVLPDEFTSVLTLNTNTGSPITVNLVGRVKTGVRLIDPTNPANAPVVTLTRSGNDFTVQFSVYDSDLNVNTATFEFMRSNGSVVGQPIIVNLRDSLPGCLAKGQSFTVTQRFTGAASNRNAVMVRVTVSDGESSDTATSNTISRGSTRSSQ
ncbi:MAG TPA: vWA domain-containing protein [Blastocatellia bacterium]|nr:vWA domain-containing protein [Blastocatellia bacterium]